MTFDTISTIILGLGAACYLAYLDWQHRDLSQTARLRLLARNPWAWLCGLTVLVGILYALPSR